VAESMPPADHAAQGGIDGAERYGVFGAQAQRGEGHVGRAAVARESRHTAILSKAAGLQSDMGEIGEGLDAGACLQLKTVAEFTERLEGAGIVFGGQAVG